MIISKIEIRAFKSIYELTLPLDPHINVLIGANESGKSNILKAIEAFRDKVALDSSFTCQYSNHYYLAKAPELALCMVIIPVVVGILRRKPQICHRFGDDRLGHDLYRERQFGDPRLPVSFVLQVKPG